MNNTENKTKQLQHSNSTNNLSSISAKTQALAATLMFCNLADEKFNYGPHQLVFWSEQVLVDYPGMTPERFKKIILRGIRGVWKEKFENHMTFSVMLGWIKKFNEEEKAEWTAKFTKDCYESMEKQMNIDQWYKLNPQNEDYLNFLISENKINSLR